MDHTPFTLIILDGWGYNEKTEHNAIFSAKTPNWDRLCSEYTHTLINCSGKAVGLPAGQMGNSEVGHINIGAGRVVYQDLVRINKEIENKAFFKNPVFVDAIDSLILSGKTLHILGLLSPGGVHSHERHIFALIKLAAEKGFKNIAVHAFLDGRDTPPKSAHTSLEQLETTFKQSGTGRVASIIGRYYAMDRDKNWERVAKAYELLTQGKADFTANSAHEALDQAYDRGETDEFVKATSIGEAIQMQEGDIVVHMNFRADRAREISVALTDSEFAEFDRAYVPKIAEFISLTEYHKELKATVAYPPQSLKNSFGEYIANLGLKQLRIAETEKYAHVTFFFNGGREMPFAGENRILVPSPKVPTYDLKPEMSALEITKQLIEAIHSKKYDAIICNFANADMVGHSGNFDATVKAIEILDDCLGDISKALNDVGGEMIVTADHGNAEKMFDDNTGQSHTAHTTDPIPLLYMGRKAKVINAHGSLSDLSPTILSLMGLEIPIEMTGKPLIQQLDHENHE